MHGTVERAPDPEGSVCSLDSLDAPQDPKPPHEDNPDPDGLDLLNTTALLQHDNENDTFITNWLRLHDGEPMAGDLESESPTHRPARQSPTRSYECEYFQYNKEDVLRAREEAAAAFCAPVSSRRYLDLSLNPPIPVTEGSGPFLPTAAKFLRSSSAPPNKTSPHKSAGAPPSPLRASPGPRTGTSPATLLGSSGLVKYAASPTMQVYRKTQTHQHHVDKLNAYSLRGPAEQEIFDTESAAPVNDIKQPQPPARSLNERLMPYRNVPRPTHFTPRKLSLVQQQPQA